MSRVGKDQPAILFVTATRIGDAVLSTSVLRRLVETHPHARFTIAAGPVAAPLFRGVPGLERLIVVEKQRFGAHWLDLYRRVAFRRWDMVVDLRGSALAWLLVARDRRVIGKGPSDRHRVAHLATLFGLAPPPAPMLWTLPAHDEAAQRLIPAGGPVLAVAPTANWPGKIWRSWCFVELVRRLTAPGAAFAGARIAVVAAPHERALAEPVLSAVPQNRLIDLTGEGDLLTVAAALRRTSLFVGNDTGLMHIAAAVGVPTLGLFGPSPPALYAPWGGHTAVVETAIPYAQLVGAADFNHRTTGTLMDTLSVDAVEAAATALARRCLVAA
ncbi:MAG TPA: glycosyltransferase family 9 protein [Stellaceae bacterium]|nr:glycosyltransferase family 9 protein [Stellaceae bacterium]